ncbi:GlsB/YeaQ/YmgE family stress response membrane protein [Corynebacterium aquilae]|uniref:Membrane protein n=1 Tax=Corynebacterium aquilae DSM 44791 TaxID=1431546 RepID=A0A1L7CIK7_9CORY|nr:GlsB/YeaQ/YmgE family stress response membrane protein [Corynebacterium aquilae]APT85696.1 membrane protein [Corynebacterium aquilae DSM 44791]
MTPTLGFFAWIIIGGLAGWIASKIKGTDAQQGLLANIIVGIIGGFLGGWILSLIGFDVAGGGLIFSLVTCVIGAVILLTILQAIRSKK